MISKQRLKEAVTHPTTAVVSVIGAITSSVWLPIDPGILGAFGATLWAHAGTLFSAGSALTFVTRLGSGMGWLQPIALGIGVSGAILYAAKLLDSFFDDFQERL